MATGSPRRANSGSNNFDFASDGILCSYEDYAKQGSLNGSHSDPPIGTNASKDFSQSRLVPPAACAAPVHSQSEDSMFQDLFLIVEKIMKRNSDNIMRFLEGISSRLSQLELYCYNLDKSVGKMRSESMRDHDEADEKLKSLEKHLQEVHRSVQILREDQELAKTQKELAKLHIAQNDSSSSQSQSNEDMSPSCDAKRTENISNVSNQQLVLALPHQIAPRPQPVLLTSQAPPQSISQPEPYYLTSIQVQTVPAPKQMAQTQYVPSGPQCCASQVHIVSHIQAQPQANHTQPPQLLSPYQQQLPQSLTQQTLKEQQLPIHSQVKAQSTAYPSYPPSEPTNPASREIQLSSGHMQEQYPGIPPSVSNHPENIAVGYSGPGRIIQQLPPHQAIKNMSAPVNNDGYRAAEPHPSFSPGDTYIVYDGDGRRVHPALQRPSIPQGSYPQPNSSLQNLQPNPPSNQMVQNLRHLQLVQSNSYNELIDKLVKMGFRVDHVLSVIRAMEESRQPVDFKSVLDRLRAPPSGNFQSGWST